MCAVTVHQLIAEFLKEDILHDRQRSTQMDLVNNPSLRHRKVHRETVSDSKELTGTGGVRTVVRNDSGRTDRWRTTDVLLRRTFRTSLSEQSTGGLFPGPFVRSTPSCFGSDKIVKKISVLLIFHFRFSVPGSCGVWLQTEPPCLTRHLLHW